MTDDTNYENSQKLSPDAEIVLYELTTTTGATVFFKPGPEMTYLGDTYESVPVSFSTEKRSTEGSPERPTITIGGDDLDLAALKPALFSGFVDGGTLTRHVVELEDVLANNNIKLSSTYRIKQVKDYTRYQINLILAKFSPSAQTTIPYVKYLRPAFTHVQL
ncbi:hypothetical protein E6Q11_02260 [Candidatus Dojkabacteria bacterium]|uniref:Phage tail protein n=1 Tax=Candidatus Dojkabacteria bacterium TaxID=2099670 RepID=A0A5C7J8C6_9BACT|nr:MAG: hypothetical protein E6Q11_02260 [Candidatus Dojkabacteria bacterium]